jgi:hypothetical protein
MIALAVYQWRRPLAWMDAGVGARIGLVVGLLLVACLGVAWGVVGLVARYGLHSMARFDEEWKQTMQIGWEKLVAMSPPPPEFQRTYFSPEFRAGYLLSVLFVGAGFLLVLSTVGGALGGFMRMRRKASV